MCERLPVQVDRVNAGIYQDKALLFGRGGLLYVSVGPPNQKKGESKCRYLFMGTIHDFPSAGVF